MTMNSKEIRAQRISALAAIVGDDGTGSLGVIVDSADADATTAELVDIVREARADAKLEAE